MKFSRAISRVRWFSFVEANVSKTIFVLVLRVGELVKILNVLNIINDIEDYQNKYVKHIAQYCTDENKQSIKAGPEIRCTGLKSFWASEKK
jgi:hypothetical protein